jgi:hypothetical protein
MEKLCGNDPKISHPAKKIGSYHGGYVSYSKTVPITVKIPFM